MGSIQVVSKSTSNITDILRGEETMTKYYADFDNQTDRAWTMALYQTLPASVGLDSVSWKQTTAPTGGSTGVDWEITFNVALADYDQRTGIGVYKADQILPAALGTAWNILSKDGVQQLEPAEAVLGEAQILITNQSGLEANPGIGMAGVGSVYKRDVLSGSNAQFEVEPAYFLGLFSDVQIGEVISSNVTVGPQRIIFPPGMNVVTAKATLIDNGQGIALDLSYSSRSATPMAVVEHRIKALAAHRDAA